MGRKTFAVHDNGNQLGSKPAELCTLKYARKKFHRDVILIIPTVEVTPTLILTLFFTLASTLKPSSTLSR